MELGQDQPVALQHFRTTVFHSAAERSKRALVIKECRCTEINEFNAEMFINDDVFVFDVTVNNAKGIQIGQCGYEL